MNLQSNEHWTIAAKIEKFFPAYVSAKKRPNKFSTISIICKIFSTLLPQLLLARSLLGYNFFKLRALQKDEGKKGAFVKQS